MSSPNPSGFWGRLTPRERIYILALVLVFFVMGTALLLFMRAQSLSSARDEIDGIRLALDDVHTRGAVYTAKMQAKRARESAIATECVQFASLLDEARGSVENITIANEEEQPILELGAGLAKCEYRFDVRAVTLEDLTQLLTFIESKPGNIILTQDLLIRSSSSSENRLNADVTLVTFRRKPSEDEAGAGAVADDEGDEP